DPVVHRLVLGRVEAGERGPEVSRGVADGNVPATVGRGGLQVGVPDVLEGAPERVPLGDVQLRELARLRNAGGKLPEVGAESQVVEAAAAVGAEVLEGGLRIAA